MPDPVDPAIVDFLTVGYWQWDGEDPHHWGIPNVTINAQELSSAGYLTWVQQAAAQVSSVANITFTFVTGSANITFHLRDGSGDSSSSVHSGGIISSAQAWIDPPSIAQDVLHEFGHMLGLGHAGQYNGDQAGPDVDVRPEADQDLTVMSYNGPEDGAQDPSPTVFQEADLAAFIRLYGAAPSNPPPTYNYITGTAASETLNGTQVADWILGKGGNDTLTGWTGNDVIAGGAGNDLIQAGGGNDQLKSGLGADTLTGGGGADEFVYDANDTVTDYRPGEGDTLRLVTDDYWL